MSVKLFRFKCRDCYKTYMDEDGVTLKARRCEPCSALYAQRKRYTNPVAQEINKKWNARLRADRKGARHCLKCCLVRPKEAFLPRSGATGLCEMCRNEEFDLEQRKEHNRRIYADMC